MPEEPSPCLTDYEEVVRALSPIGFAKFHSWSEVRLERFLSLYRADQARGNRTVLGSILHAWGPSAKGVPTDEI